MQVSGNKEGIKSKLSIPLSLKTVDYKRFLGVAEPREGLPSSPTLLLGEKGARVHVPSPFGRGLG